MSDKNNIHGSVGAAFLLGVGKGMFGGLGGPAPNQEDGDTITYKNLTLPRAMWPYAPGSEAVVRNLPRIGQDTRAWEKDIFIVMQDGEYLCYDCGGFNTFVECHPLATHGHLLGTTYPADTPACAKCGKAAYNACFCEGKRVCEDCFTVHTEKPTSTTADGVMEQLAAITAERDALRAELEAKKEHAAYLLDQLLLTEKRADAVNEKMRAVLTLLEGNAHLLGTTDSPEAK